jgi:hypothetical protein
MAISLDAELKSKNQVVFHIYTDQPKEAEEVSKSLKASEVCVHTIESLGWPEATLLRYSVFSSDWEDISQETVVYIDADMLIRVDIAQKFSQFLDKSKINLVSHPGFYRPTNLLSRIRFYINNPKFLASDARMYLRLGGLGDWETDKTSMAYVRRRNRIHYVCGGVWAGPNKLIKDLCQELAINVNADKDIGMTARWHDESHLNCWASTRGYNRLEPAFCHEHKYPQLKAFSAFITAVDKNEK